MEGLGVEGRDQVFQLLFHMLNDHKWAETEPGQSKAPRASSRSTWVQGPKDLGKPLLPSAMQKLGTRSEMRQSGLVLVPKWDASTVGDGLIHHVPGPSKKILSGRQNLDQLY